MQSKNNQKVSSIIRNKVDGYTRKSIQVQKIQLINKINTMKIQTLKKCSFTQQNLSKLIVFVLLINTACSNKHHNSNDSDETVKAQIELL